MKKILSYKIVRYTKSLSNRLIEQYIYAQQGAEPGFCYAVLHKISRT